MSVIQSQCLHPFGPVPCYFSVNTYHCERIAATTRLLSDFSPAKQSGTGAVKCNALLNFINKMLSELCLLPLPTFLYPSLPRLKKMDYHATLLLISPANFYRTNVWRHRYCAMNLGSAHLHLKSRFSRTLTNSEEIKIASGRRKEYKRNEIHSGSIVSHERRQDQRQADDEEKFTHPDICTG